MLTVQTRHKRGCPVARVDNTNDQTIVNINEVTMSGHGQHQRQNRSTKQEDNTMEYNVPDEYMTCITRLVSNNQDLFAEKDTELGHTNTVKMHLNTGDHPPIKLKPYRTQLNNRKVIDKAIDEMMEAKIIKRSGSPWSFPVVIVYKKDASKRFCVDFRKLNQITKPISYPLPVIDDILALLGKAKYFTSLSPRVGTGRC